MAEETGFEPVDIGVKTLCLTTWRFLRILGIKIARVVSHSGYVY